MVTHKSAGVSQSLSNLCGLHATIILFSSHFVVSPLLFLVLSVNFMPESPRWLFKNGQENAALIILGRLRSSDGNVNEEARKELAEIKTAAALEAHSNFSYFDM